MSLAELARPITIYWDLIPSPILPPDYSRFCDQLKTIKPLQLHLLDDDSCSATLQVLAHLQNIPLAVVLTAAPAALTAALIENLHSLGLKGLLLQTSSCSGLMEAKAVKDLVVGRFATGISFQVHQGNWQELPQVVESCLLHGFSSLTLPMQRLYGNEQAFRLTPQEHATLTKALSKSDYNALRLTIHDPFLWRAFKPGLAFPGNGCQAANTMLAIAPDGTVYPCPALPLLLGNLHQSTLAEIVSSAGKKELRRSLKQPPPECAACVEVNHCLGGCRGRTFIGSGELSTIDPACPIF